MLSMRAPKGRSHTGTEYNHHMGTEHKVYAGVRTSSRSVHCISSPHGRTMSVNTGTEWWYQVTPWVVQTVARQRPHTHLT
jgi:hypothetical protein